MHLDAGGQRCSVGPLGGRAKHVARPAHAHSGAEIGDAVLCVQQMRTHGGPVRIQSRPGRFNPVAGGGSGSDAAYLRSTSRRAKGIAALRAEHD